MSGDENVAYKRGHSICNLLIEIEFLWYWKECACGEDTFSLNMKAKPNFFLFYSKTIAIKATTTQKKNSQAKHYDLYSHKLKRIDIKRKNEAEKNNKTTK